MENKNIYLRYIEVGFEVLAVLISIIAMMVLISKGFSEPAFSLEVKNYFIKVSIGAIGVVLSIWGIVTGFIKLNKLISIGLLAIATIIFFFSSKYFILSGVITLALIIEKVITLYKEKNNKEIVENINAISVDEEE